MDQNQKEILEVIEKALERVEKNRPKPEKKQCIDWFAGMVAGGISAYDIATDKAAVIIYDLAEAMYEESLKRYGL
jgi:hypothetical protein